MPESRGMEDGSIETSSSKGWGWKILLIIFIVAVVTAVILIATNIIDLRGDIEFSGTPGDSTIQGESEYKSSKITVLKKDTTDEAKNVSIRLSDDSPDWLNFQNGYIQGTTPEFKIGLDATNEYKVTIETNYEKGTKKNNVITHSFTLTVEAQELEFQSLLDDAQVLFGAEFKSAEIKVLNQTGVEASNVTLTLTSPTTGELKLNNGYIESKAPEFEGNFDELVLDPLFVEVSATDGVSTITQSFNITVVFPDLQDIEWDPDESSKNVTNETEEVVIDGGTVTKSRNNLIAWAISKNPLPPDTKAAIVEFTVNDIGTGDGGNYSQVLGLDLINENISKSLDTTNDGLANVLTQSEATRFGIAFTHAVNSSDNRAQSIRYRGLGTAAGTVGTAVDYKSGQLASTFTNATVIFHIYDSKIQNVIIEGTSFGGSHIGYDLGDMSTNDWYLTIRDPKNDTGFLNSTGRVAILT